MTDSTLYVCPAGHRHGASSTCYNQHGCRCSECRAGRAAIQRKRMKAKAYGRYQPPYDLVPAEPVREHVWMLMDFGIGYQRVAEVSGVSDTTVSRLIYGRKGGPAARQRRGEVVMQIVRASAERILAVKPDIDNMAEGRAIPARGFQRRAQALAANGWSLTSIGRRLGLSPQNFHGMMRAERVEVRTHRAMVALFDELWDEKPTAATGEQRAWVVRTKEFARKRRWLPPLAWDDIDNDIEPPVAEADEEMVDEIAVQLAMSGESVRLSPLERREAIRRLNAVKLGDGEIAARIGIAHRSVFRIRQELGLPAAVGADGRAVA